MAILERILSVFRTNYPNETRDLVWKTCMTCAMQAELNQDNLDNMCGTPLVSGFGGGGGREEVIKLAKALGVCGVSNPENDAHIGVYGSCNPSVEHLPTDEILDKIQRHLPFAIDFPPFSGNCQQGLVTKYGVTANRHIFYLWVLKRIIELCPDRNCGIIEIGAGFGVLGYYLDRAGYRDYTTVDLALVNACQTYFLAKNLPERQIILSGDVADPFAAEYKDAIKLLHSTDFHDVPRDRFAIMINMDGLTEYGIAEATKYVQSDCAPIFLSINHSVNSYRVIDLSQHRRLAYRYLFWLRDGYVEELYVNK